jgi:hypothetical protein
VALVVMIVALTAFAFRDRAQLPSGMRTAIRAELVGAQVAGGVMIATGVRLVVRGDPALAYSQRSPPSAFLAHPSSFWP